MRESGKLPGPGGFISDSSNAVGEEEEEEELLESIGVSW